MTQRLADVRREGKSTVNNINSMLKWAKNKEHWKDDSLHAVGRRAGVQSSGSGSPEIGNDP